MSLQLAIQLRHVLCICQVHQIPLSAVWVFVQLRVMVNSASLLTTLLFALGNLLGQNLGNHVADWSQYYGVFLAVSWPLAKAPSCLGFLYAQSPHPSILQFGCGTKHVDRCH